MKNLVGFAMTAVVVAVAWWLNTLRERAITPRTYLTYILDDRTIEQVFAEAVTGWGWNLQLSNRRAIRNPLIGTRQSITVAISHLGDGATHVWIGPDQVSLLAGLPNKAWTIRWRLGRFERRLRALDPNLAVTDRIS